MEEAVAVSRNRPGCGRISGTRGEDVADRKILSVCLLPLWECSWVLRDQGVRLIAGQSSGCL